MHHAETTKQVAIEDVTVLDTAQYSSIASQPLEEREVVKPNSKPTKVPSIPCTVPGCDKLFTSYAERDNHVAFNHYADTDTTVLDIEYAHPTSLPPDAHVEEDEGEATLIAEATIKPKLTAESLQALEASISSDPAASITRSLHTMSINNPRDSSESLMSLDETTFSVNDPIEEQESSDVASEEDPHVQLSVYIVLCLWAKYVNEASRKSQQGFRQHGPRANPQGRRSSYSISKESLPSSVASSEVSGASALRRKRSSDDGDSNNRKIARKNKADAASGDDKPLACPFNKFDNFRFGNDPNNPQYHTCNTWSDVKTAYFKQHLLRNHCAPEFQCDRCGNDQVNQVALRAHLRADIPCEKQDLGDCKILREDQIELGLRGRNPVGLDRTKYWLRVYDTIFGPEARKQRDVDPYYTGPYQEIVQQFVHFSQVRMPAIMRRSREILGLEPSNSIEQDAELSRTILQEAMQAFMAELSQNQRPSLHAIRAQNTITPAMTQQPSATRDFNRPLPNVRPANWQSALPLHIAPSATQISQISPQGTQRQLRPAISAPTTPAPVPPASQNIPVMQGQLPFQPEQSFPDSSWANYGDYTLLGTNDFDHLLPQDDRFTAEAISQNDMEGFCFVNNIDANCTHERRLH